MSKESDRSDLVHECAHQIFLQACAIKAMVNEGIGGNDRGSVTEALDLIPELIKRAKELSETLDIVIYSDMLAEEAEMSEGNKIRRLNKTKMFENNGDIWAITPIHDGGIKIDLCRPGEEDLVHPEGNEISVTNYPEGVFLFRKDKIAGKGEDTQDYCSVTIKQEVVSEENKAKCVCSCGWGSKTYPWADFMDQIQDAHVQAHSNDKVEVTIIPLP